jgi:type IV pilus assembly protein PilM
MAKTNAVWGIDIGQCGLKAMRCTLGEDGESIVADAFDFIEYPKILSQPEAEPDELVKEALEQFLSRNELRGDQVCMSVSGQAGLSRFFKPPPMQAKTLPAIVKFEAKQQIPFNLNDVVWDFQQIGGMVIDGFTMDAEIGLFAMKRDAVFRALQPFTDADVEVDLIQLSPLAIYNAVAFELLGDAPPADEIDPENPPESIIILSMGTDTTDLVVTDGSHLWQRSIPIGGNHFTKQLSKELKLTYAKAEHLKRNARQAEDPKKVFQVMRPVFNDLVTEVQRSITYFQSIDRNATIGRMVMLGNAVKLPGLRQYLSKNLGLEAAKFDKFENLTGPTVVSSPSFKDNVLSFGVSYGLCLQQLNKAKLSTNLLPHEFVVERMVREKKPWALASVGALLLALTFNFYFCYNAWYKTKETFADKPDGPNWTKAQSEVETASNRSQGLISTDNELMGVMNRVRALGDEVIGDADRKRLWLELTRAIHKAVPEDPAHSRNIDANPDKLPYLDRVDLRIESIDSQYFDDLSKWYNKEIDRRWGEQEKHAAAKGWVSSKAAEEDSEDSDSAAYDDSGAYGSDGGDSGVSGGPTGSGVIAEIKGHHFHNSADQIQNENGGGNYVRNTLLRQLREMKVKWPVPLDEATLDFMVHIKPDVREHWVNKLGGPQGLLDELSKDFTFEEMGVGYAILVEDRLNSRFQLPNPNHPMHAEGASQGTDGMSTPTAAPTGTGPKKKEEEDESAYKGPPDYSAPKHNFTVQFSWQPKSMSQRLEARIKELEEKMREEKAKAEQDALESGTDTVTQTGG